MLSEIQMFELNILKENLYPEGNDRHLLTAKGESIYFLNNVVPHFSNATDIWLIPSPLSCTLMGTSSICSPIAASTPRSASGLPMWQRTTQHCAATSAARVKPFAKERRKEFTSYSIRRNYIHRMHERCLTKVGVVDITRLMRLTLHDCEKNLQSAYFLTPTDPMYGISAWS